MKWFIKCLKHYADFKGRARRKEYWYFTLFNCIFAMILYICYMVSTIIKGVASGAITADEYNEMQIYSETLKSPFLYIYYAYLLAMLIPSLSVGMRRLHDIGKSGYWMLLLYIVDIILCFGSGFFVKTSVVITIILFLAILAIGIIWLVWMVTDSEYGPNKYGPNPKGEGNPETPVKE